MLILAVVGLLVGSWITAGVVPAMIYYGLMILSPGIFLFAGCILCAIVALATGSSWTTAATIGIALIGVGSGLGIDPAMTAGAVVSGAYFGDKMSPLSDTTNLAPAMAGSNLFDHIRHMVWTVTPSLVIALVLYLILGLRAGDADMSLVGELQAGITDSFNVNLALLIPPLLVIVIVALKLPALPGLLGGVLLGCIFGSMFQGVALADWFGFLHYGFAFADSSVVMPDLVSLLERGGMDGMMWTINLILCAMCFGGVMDSSGMLANLAEGLLKIVKGTGALVTVTVFSCIFMNIIAGDQYLAIVLPGRMYKSAFEDAHLAPKNLSRVLEDAGTMTSNLVPWNTCGAYMTSVMGVGQWGAGGYAPYAFLCWINPLVSIFYGFTGISMTKMTDEEYAKVLEEREKERLEGLASLEA
jgi:NhaC family Na+:H+ antiporter